LSVKLVDKNGTVVASRLSRRTKSSPVSIRRRRWPLQRAFGRMAGHHRLTVQAL
jgi:hypothetical protein